MSQTTINHILEFLYFNWTTILYTAYRALRATDKQNELGLHYFGLY